MTKIYFLKRTKEFTLKVYKSLLDLIFPEGIKQDRAIGFEWISSKTVKFNRISKGQLQDLYGSPRTDRKTFENEIRPAIADYLQDMGIIKNMKTHVDLRTFELHLWDEDSKENNLVQFDRVWDIKAQEEAKNKASTKKASKTQSSITQIDWHTKCKKLLEKHKERLASNDLQNTIAKNFDVYVPLGVVKRDEQQRPAIDRDLDPSAERGSELYREQTTPISHDAFLAAVLDRQSPGHIAILGEPGAGKTTLLTKVWDYLIEKFDGDESSIVAWVPLARLENKDLVTYLKEVWLGQICPTIDIPPTYWEEFQALATAGKVWLLLDGADEMGGDGLTAIANILKQGWMQPLRAIVTCRLNLWDAGNNQLRSNFQIFRTMEFSYNNPDKPNEERDEVNTFIKEWFDRAEAGTRLRSALNEPGKERIKDLAQNPLRLTLLCNIWRQKENLPDTQAGLYKEFVNYFYNWKAKPEIVKLRNELDRSMGVLAKYGLNKPSLRFRFTETEIRTVVDAKCQAALKDSGWLNCVGGDREQESEEIYAFFHPTFQEYFAACTIEDWDYFMPRNHKDKPVDKAIYRVFEAEWRQVILLWIGRGDVAEEWREEFIERLMKFEEGFGNKFYYYRAYCMAAICVGEFRSSTREDKSSKRAKEIVEQIVEWLFGCFNTEKREWRTYLAPISYLAEDTIPFAHRQKAIEVLVALLNDDKLSDWLLCSVATVLGKIDVGNEQAIDVLLTLLNNYKFGFFDLPNASEICSNVIQSLRRVAVGNKQAIEGLVALLNDYKSYDWWGEQTDIWRYLVTEALGVIENDLAIKEFPVHMKNDNLPDFLIDDVRQDLGGNIEIGNEQSIKSLITLLKKADSNNYLKQILTQEKMPSVIWRLKNYVTDKVYNSNFKRFNFCFKVLFHCAQTLTYPDFYAAWHPSLPLIPFDPISLHRQLNRPHTAILDLCNFHSSHPTDIATELTTHIYLALQIAPIPTDIDTIPKLKQALINLNLSPHLVLICYYPHPTPELVREISNLEYTQRIQRIWLSEDAIDRALQPEQENLAEAIQSAILRWRG